MPRGRQRLERHRRRLHRNQAVGERETVVPEMVDHRMVGGGAGIDPRDTGLRRQHRRELIGELHAGREAGDAFVVGDLPEPGGVAGGERDRGGDSALAEHHAVDPRLAARRQRADRGFDEAPHRRIVGGRAARRPSSRWPPAPENPPAPTRSPAVARGGERHRRDVVEPPALALQLLALGRHGLLQLMAGPRRFEHGACVCWPNSACWPVAGAQHRVERAANGPSPAASAA